MLEVEQKFRVVDPRSFESRLLALGGELGVPQLQSDRYFNHPAHDFAHTDEALRIRQAGEQNYLTYKGPKLDSTTKTRREIEVPIAPGQAAAEQFAELLIALGFRPVADVQKQRRKAVVERQGRRIEVVLDRVDGLGMYVELEIVAAEEEMAIAQQAIRNLAHELELVENERKSYLELLLDRQ